MIHAWRSAFKSPEALFLFVQLSTWCALPPESLPQMRQAQMAAVSLPNVGYATNADHGMGCNIHPSAKQYVSERLASAAEALLYNRSIPWRSPTYSSVAVVVGDAAATPSHTRTVSVTVQLRDVGAAGLELLYPFNYRSPGYGPAATQVPTVVDCTSTFPVSPTENASMGLQCGWSSIRFDTGGWVNATLSVGANGQSLVLAAAMPLDAQTAVATAYGWAPIPMLSAYDKTSGLPVLPWNRTIENHFL